MTGTVASHNGTAAFPIPARCAAVVSLLKRFGCSGACHRGRRHAVRYARATETAASTGRERPPYRWL